MADIEGLKEQILEDLYLNTWNEINHLYQTNEITLNEFMKLNEFFDNFFKDRKNQEKYFNE